MMSAGSLEEEEEAEEEGEEEKGEEEDELPESWDAALDARKPHRVAACSGAAAAAAQGKKRTFALPKPTRNRGNDKDTEMASLLKCQVEFKCMRCASFGGHRANTIKKKSLKKHRAGGNCKEAKKMRDHIDEMVMAAPPPLSAEEARAAAQAAASHTVRSGI